jgi:hypothetical protein
MAATGGPPFIGGKVVRGLHYVTGQQSDAGAELAARENMSCWPRRNFLVIGNASRL